MSPLFSSPPCSLLDSAKAPEIHHVHTNTCSPSRSSCTSSRWKPRSRLSLCLFLQFLHSSQFLSTRAQGPCSIIAPSLSPDHKLFSTADLSMSCLHKVFLRHKCHYVPLLILFHQHLAILVQSSTPTVWNAPYLVVLGSPCPQTCQDPSHRTPSLFLGCSSFLQEAYQSNVDLLLISTEGCHDSDMVSLLLKDRVNGKWLRNVRAMKLQPRKSNFHHWLLYPGVG